MTTSGVRKESRGGILCENSMFLGLPEASTYQSVLGETLT